MGYRASIPVQKKQKQNSIETEKNLHAETGRVIGVDAHHSRGAGAGGTGSLVLGRVGASILIQLVEESVVLSNKRSIRDDQDCPSA